MILSFQVETDCKHTKAGGELVEGEESIAVGIKGIKHILQLLRTEREPVVQPLFNKTQNTAAIAKNKTSRTLTILLQQLLF